MNRVLGIIIAIFGTMNKKNAFRILLLNFVLNFLLLFLYVRFGAKSDNDFFWIMAIEFFVTIQSFIWFPLYSKD